LGLKTGQNRARLQQPLRFVVNATLDTFWRPDSRMVSASLPVKKSSAEEQHIEPGKTVE
jgi:hypothetical protein